MNNGARTVTLKRFSSTLYQGLHTYLNSAGQIFQETPGSYLDGSSPVLLLALLVLGLILRDSKVLSVFIFFISLGLIPSPFQLNVSLAYNYNSSPSQTILVSFPTNPYRIGAMRPVWGAGGPLGRPRNWGLAITPKAMYSQLDYSLAHKKMLLVSTRQVQEVYDPTVGQPAEGLTLSGLNLIIGSKKGYRTQTTKSFG